MCLEDLEEALGLKAPGGTGPRDLANASPHDPLERSTLSDANVLMQSTAGLAMGEGLQIAWRSGGRGSAARSRGVELLPWCADPDRPWRLEEYTLMMDQHGSETFLVDPAAGLAYRWRMKPPACPCAPRADRQIRAVRVVTRRRLRRQAEPPGRLPAARRRGRRQHGDMQLRGSGRIPGAGRVPEGARKARLLGRWIPRVPPCCYGFSSALRGKE